MQQWHLLEMLGQLSSFRKLFENTTRKIAELMTVGNWNLGIPTPKIEMDRMTGLATFEFCFV